MIEVLDRLISTMTVILGFSLAWEWLVFGFNDRVAWWLGLLAITSLVSIAIRVLYWIWVGVPFVFFS